MGSSATLKPTFALRSDFDVVEANEDWDGLTALTRSNRDAWNAPHVSRLLTQKGYTLDGWAKERTDDSEPQPPYPSNPPSQPSVKISDGEIGSDFDPYPFMYQPLCARKVEIVDGSGITIGGRDAQGRCIVVKAFDSRGDEGAIYRHLYKEAHSALRENCMLPILDIIDFDKKVSFAVMPMWNANVSGARSKSIGDMSVFIHSLLKGMTYMHHNRIVHRDIRHTNYAVNYRESYHTKVHGDPVLLQLRKARKICVACLDFDLSKMYPRETDLAAPRLPWWRAITNDDGQPTPELEQGELEYNPFPLEVARLGYHFVRYYRYAILDVPTLAPLISMMIDWDVSRRFTAEEALAFYETHCMPRVNELWGKACQVFNGDPMEIATYEEYYDPWYMTTPFFKRQWASHQPRPMPLFRRILRRICQWESGLRMIRQLRSFWDNLYKLRLSKASINITI